jgi:hypothetical protein
MGQGAPLARGIRRRFGSKESVGPVAGRGPTGRQGVAPPDEGGWGTRQPLDLSPKGPPGPDRNAGCAHPVRGVPERPRSTTMGIIAEPRRTRLDANPRPPPPNVPVAPCGRWGKNAGMPPTPASFVGRGYALSAPGGASIPPDSAESPKSRSRRALRMIGGREIREARRQSRPEGPEGRSPTRRRRVGSSFREYSWSTPRRRVPGEKGAAGGGLGDTAAGSAASPIRWSTPHRSRVREAKTTAGQRICRSWCDRVADQTGPPKYRAAV